MMADDAVEKRLRAKKKKSSLLTWKKKFNIKKRFTNKLPVHRRHIRSLMAGWSLQDVKSVLVQYEITAMLRELSIMADKSRIPAQMLNQDLLHVYKSSSCWDMIITCCEMAEDQCSLMHNRNGFHREFKVHSCLVSARWPYLRGIISEQMASSKRSSFPESDDFNPYLEKMSDPCGSNINLMKWSVHINGLHADKLEEMLIEIYNGVEYTSPDTSPRKLMPLPTTDDSLHIRNSRGNKHHFRHTIFEIEQPPMARRRSSMRRKHKHRFSMDERILSKQHHSPAPSRVHKVRPSKPNEVVLDSTHHLDTSKLFFENSFATSPSRATLPNLLQDDLLRMYQDAQCGSGDLKIVISTAFPLWKAYARKEDILFCHRVILASRSPYFKRLIERERASNTDHSSLQGMLSLELDGSIIPAKWMSTILYAMYTDKIHFFHLCDRIGQGMPLSNSLFNVEDAIALHHIGHFIEFPQLVYACEELIVNNLDERNIFQVLQWASLPHGSEWVKRQVNIFIRDRFTELLGTEVLFKLSASQIIEVMKSDFIDASELDILKCALRWGEHELIRRIEENEPNLLTHTTHSISRSKTASARRRELMNDRIEVLHECTAPVLACVRTQHLLPPNHDTFVNAVKRGVISRPPSDLLENFDEKENGSRRWVKSSAGFVPPRLFQPYVDETKSILDERLAQDNDNVTLRSLHSVTYDSSWESQRHQVDLSHHGIPDTLYMVGQSKVPMRRRYGNRDLHLSFLNHRTDMQKQKNKFIGNCYPVPDISVVRDMMSMEREMRSSILVNKILLSCSDCCHSNGSGFAVVSYAGRSSITQAEVNPSHEDADETEHCNRCTALRLVRLYVVRKQGLPDCAVDLLQHPEIYYSLSELRGVTVTNATHSAGKNYERFSQTHELCKVESTDLRRYSTSIQPRQYNNNVPNDHNKLNSTHDGTSQSVWGKNVSDISHPEPGFGFFRSSKITDLSSSSDEEITKFVCRKRSSMSRKGSSSATSYQSIPDVAASANSSLQRLRRNSRKFSSDLRDMPLISSNFDNHDAQLQKESPDTESNESSFSSFEENTTENDFDSAPSGDRHEIIESEMIHISQNAVLSLNETVELGAARFHPPRRSISAGIADHFNSVLDFANTHSNDEDISSLSPRRIQLKQLESKLTFNIPELLKDGTVPCSQGEHLDANSSTFCSKPDIYSNHQNSKRQGDTCGQYFLCSLTRDSAVNDQLGPEHRQYDPSFESSSCSFNDNQSVNTSHNGNELDSVDNETIFL